MSNEQIPNELRADVLRRDNHQCQFCGLSDSKHEDKHGRGLHVHHILPQRAESNHRRYNLITVCKECHDQLEYTQARAIAALFDSVEESYDGQDNAEILSVGKRYTHDFYGEVKVIDLDLEPVSLMSDGVKYDGKVRFGTYDMDRMNQQTEPIQRFIQSLDDLESQLPRKVANEVQQR